MKINKVKVPIVVKDGGKLPKYSHKSDSGLDIYTSEDVDIYPGETVIVPTGLYLADLPEDYEVQLRPRSGISSKTNLSLVNSPGTVDEGYRGEIGIPIRNNDINFAKYFDEYVGGCIVDLSRLDEELKLDGTKFINKRVPVTYHIPKGTRLVQMVFAKVAKVDIVETSTQVESDRGESGFGSSGVN